MATLRTVGVIGGLGPAATVDFMTRVIEATPAATDQGHVPMLVDHNPTLPNRHEALARGDRELGVALAAMARRLETAGADFLVMVCNTAHAWEEQIRAAVAIPFLSIITVTVDALAARVPARVGLLAADGCLAAGLYQRALGAAGHEVVLLDRAGQRVFMDLVYRIKAGERGDAVLGGMRGLAGRLAARGAEVIVAGCTEIPLVMPASAAPLPLYSSTDLLVARTLREAGVEARQEEYRHGRVAVP